MEPQGPFVHANAIVDSSVVLGAKTRVWAFAHVQVGSTVGSSCNIGECVFIEAGAVVGDRVTIKNGVQVWAGVTLANDVFVGPNVTFCNDKSPRSGQYLTSPVPTMICAGASLGANATILPGVTVGTGAMVGAGSVVTHNVPAHTTVVGNPARHLKSNAALVIPGTSRFEDPLIINVRGVQKIKLKEIVDRRGKLIVGQHLPWVPKRLFFIRDVPKNELRGYHAHKACKQLLIAITGKVNILLDDGCSRQMVMLDDPSVGLELNPLVWSSQHYLTTDATLLVLCSEEHQPELYIHNYEEFLAAIAVQSTAIAIQPATQPIAISEEELVPVPFLNMKLLTDSIADDLRGAFERVLNSGIFVQGPEVRDFEAEWAAFCGAKFCAGVGSGLAALHLMLVACDIGPQDEVIVASNGYIATVLAVTMAGAVPIFVEPCPYTYNLDPSKVEAAISRGKTKAILSTDLYGRPADMSTLHALATKHNILLLSDCAQSQGATLDGRLTGSLCHASAFSFYPSKNLGALGEAGAVVTNDAQLADRITVLRNYGSRVRYHNEVKGYNERLDPLQAAFLRVKIPLLQEWNAKRTAIAHEYLAALAGIPWLTLPDHIVPGCLSNWHLFVVRCVQRDALMSHLQSRNVASMIHYPIPPHLSDAYKDLGYGPGSFPIAEMLALQVMSLPCCPTMSHLQIRSVIAAVKSFVPK